MVLVCHEHRFVYLKTTKTAGTSAEMVLQPLCEEPGLELTHEVETRVSKYGVVGARGPDVLRTKPKWQFWRKYPWYNHMPAREVRSNLGAKTFDAYSKIAAVRNPFDRAVSDFHFKKSRRGLPSEDTKTELAQFREFILSENWTNNWAIVSIKGQLVVDQFVRKEHLMADLAAIFAGFGLPTDDFDVPHTKSMAKRRKSIPVKEYFDPATIEVVRRKMAWVFDAVDYPDSPQD